MNHFTTSIIKSALRLIGCLGALVGYFIDSKLGLSVGVMILALTFFIAEIFGIVEELVDKRKE